MDHTAIVSVGDRLAYRNKACQQATELQSQITRRRGGLGLVGVLFVGGLQVSEITFDRIVQRLAVNVTHRVERTIVSSASKPVQRHHAGVLESTGDFGFQGELAATLAGVTEM